MKSVIGFAAALSVFSVCGETLIWNGSGSQGWDGTAANRLSEAQLARIRHNGASGRATRVRQDENGYLAPVGVIIVVK